MKAENHIHIYWWIIGCLASVIGVCMLRVCTPPNK